MLLGSLYAVLLLIASKSAPAFTSSAAIDFLEALAHFQEVSALSRVSRYAGMGYNILRGNPEGDFDIGGKDPGIKTTRWVFDHTYESGKKAFYQDHGMDVPDQINFHMTETCAASQSTRAFSGQTSYKDQLSTNIDASAGYTGLISLAFSLSGGMAKAEENTEKQKRVIIEKSLICNYGRARYLLENALAGIKGYELSESFKSAVSNLPETYDQQVYAQFIENWGTHVILTADIGIRRIERATASYSDVYHYLKKHNSFGISLNGGYAGNGVKVGVNLDDLNENIDYSTQLGISLSNFIIGSKRVPLPIYLEVKPITIILTEKCWRDNNWNELRINLKVDNLKQALHDYPSYTKAHINQDPMITETPKWPDGTYSLPEPASGCPPKWSNGYRKQDTENIRNSNDWSEGIKSRLHLGIDHHFITTYYCSKTKGTTKFNVFDWPRGRYCIAKSGLCPTDFHAGYIHWDDASIRNENGMWGVLPDGKYDKNTKVEYCCRSDGLPNEPIPLPTEMPFVLYRYGGRCQQVAGMTVHEDYIKWDDENFLNKDKCSGEHPDDDSCNNDHFIYYCHYAATG